MSSVLYGVVFRLGTYRLMHFDVLEKVGRIPPHYTRALYNHRHRPPPKKHVGIRREKSHVYNIYTVPALIPRRGLRRWRPRGIIRARGNGLVYDTAL